MKTFDEFAEIEDLENLVRCLREDGYTDDEIEEILILVEDGRSIDNAIQSSME